MDIHRIAQALGGEVVGPHSILAPGPGHSPDDRSLSITFGGDGSFVTHSFAGDGWAECRDHVQDKLALAPYRPPPVRVVPRPAPGGGDHTALALAIWRECRDPAGTLVEKYLASRGLRLAGAADVRFHPALRNEQAIMPGMVCLLRDVWENEPCGISRTFLDPTGRKLGRKMLGRAKGAAVKLSADAEVTTGVGITEGVETGLAVLQAGWHPVWAALSAGGIAAFPLLGGIGSLTIFADQDNTGISAAQVCQTRWLEAGREASIVLPDRDGDDWNSRTWREAGP